MTDNTDSSTMDERNEQTLTDIQNLQQIEQDLYNTLETSANNNTLTEDQKTKIIDKINELSQMRINLYANLKDTYGFFQKNVSSSRITLDEQIVALEIVENELAESKKRLKLLEDEKYNKLRQVEINTYYGKRYDSHTDVMKMVVIMCIPILILGMIINADIFPQRIMMALMVLVIVIGVIAIGYKIVDNMKRDNMNYDEYDWGFNEKNAPTDGTIIDIDPWVIPGLECYGPACCIEGLSTYDSVKNKCVPNTIYNSASYQVSNTGTNSTYKMMQNTNSGGNDLLSSPIANSNASACQASCTSNSDCGGFVINTANNCFLKNSSVATAATSSLEGTDLYIRTVNDTSASVTTESFINNNYNKLNYSMY
jgi:hypothetical protein